MPLNLGPIDFEVGVIAGDRTVNLILSLFLPNPDDGKVSVERTQVEGMTDFIVLPHSHPFIMRAEPVMDQIEAFLAEGRFRPTTS